MASFFVAQNTYAMLRTMKFREAKTLISKRQFSRPVALVVAVLAVLGGTYVVVSSFASQTKPTNNASLEHRAGAPVDNTKVVGKLLFESQQLQIAALDLKHNPGKKAKLQPQLKTIADARKADLLGVIKTDPQAARKLMMSDQALAALAQYGLSGEQHVTLSGILGFKQIDDNEGDRIYTQITTPDGKTYTLNDNRPITNVTLGSTIKVAGHVLDDQVLVDTPAGSDPPSTLAYAAGADGQTGTAQPVTVTTAVAGTSTGPITDVIMFANFAGQTPIDVAKYKAMYDGTPGADVASFTTENSHGKASLAPTYFSLGDFPSIACSDITGQTNAMKTALLAQTTQSYQIYTYLSNCNSGGFASKSGSSPPSIYIGGRPDLYAHIHEFSHTLGSFLGHGAYFDCAPQVFISPLETSFDQGYCISSEYEDAFDTLGSSPRHLSTSHKLDAGWLDSTQVTTVTTPGTASYTLKPYELSDGLVALKIPRGNSGTFFTVEYRQPQGFDTGICTALSKCNVTQGALLRMAGIGFPGPGGGSDSNVIDNTPGSNYQSFGYWPTGDEYDGALLPGQTFTDSDYGITVKTTSADSTGLNVEVTLASTCTRGTPAVSTPSPALQTSTPGVSKTFNVTVTNTDSAGCSASSLRYMAPTLNSTYDIIGRNEVTATASPSYFTLAPGASQTVPITVSSTPNAPDGDYFTTPWGMGRIVSSTYGTPFVVVTGGIFRLATAADTTPPTAPGTPTALTPGSATTQISWSPSTDNVGVTAYKVLINGANIYTTTDTSIQLSSLLPSTSYTFTVQALDHKSNASPASSGSFTTPAKTDTVAPSAVGNMTVSATDHNFTFSWLKPVDNVGIVSYNATTCITRNCGNFKADHTSVTADRSANYPDALTLYAYDADGNTAGYYSAPIISFRTAVAGDPVAPSQPGQLYAPTHSSDPAIGTTLTWQPSTDDKSIAGYNVYRGAGRIAFTTTNNYTDLISPGSVYRVQAVDADGSVSPISNSIILNYSGVGSTDKTPPSAALTVPSEGATVSGTVTATVNAIDDGGHIGSVTYFLDGQPIRYGNDGELSYAIDTKQFPDGPHWLMVEVGDGHTNVSSTKPVNIIINNTNADLTAPTVSLTAPTGGSTVSGTASVTATASDAAGIAKVEFQVDGTTVATTTTSPYTYAWDSTKSPNGVHTLTATAYDPSGNKASSSASVTVQNSDAQAPSAPTGLTATVGSSTRVDLAWTASTDNVGVVGYYIVRDGVTIAQASGIATTYSDATALPNTSYAYQVMAYDAAGNISGLSPSVTAQTPPAPDTQVPSAPLNLTATSVSTSQINLSWAASTDNVGVTGYDVYRGGTKIATSTTTSFGDTGLNPSTSYSYYVIARDVAGNSSSQSAVATAVTSPLVTTATILGTATNTKGATLSGVTITTKFGGANHTYTTDATGKYSITNLPAGTYKLTFKLRSYTQQTVTVTVTSSQTFTQNVVMR
jgi:chitodextrinase